MHQVCGQFFTRLLRSSATIPLVSQFHHCRHVQQARLLSLKELRPHVGSNQYLPQTALMVFKMDRQCQQWRTITADSSTTAVTIWKDLKQIRSSPLPALVFGFSGLIPFAFVPLYMITTQIYSPDLEFVQMAYGACILSFLGGTRWGYVIAENSCLKADWHNLGYSVFPSLVAWLGLLFPSPVSILVVMSGIAVTAYFDTTVKGYPSWFKGLRFILSLGALLSLWSAFLCRYMLSSDSKKELDRKKIIKGDDDLEENKQK